MKILIVVPWDKEYGGVVSVVGNLATYLQRHGHEVFFFHTPRGAVFLRKIRTKLGFPGFQLRLGLPYGIHHPVLNSLAFFLLLPFTIYQLLRCIQKHDIQVINIHYVQDNFAYFSVCRRLLPVKLVTSVHGADIFPDGKRQIKYSRAMKFILNSSDIIVAPSMGYQKEFLEIFPDYASKMIIIGNGVNVDELYNDSRGGDRNVQEPYILCIAMHNKKKGLDVLLRAFTLFQDSLPAYRLVLVGDGPLRGELESLADSLKIRKRVEFLGAQGRANVAKLLHGCEIFVLPSRSEPFGIVIIEALACKKPVIATNVGGIVDIIEHQKTGILVEPDNPYALANAIVALLKDQALQHVMGENGFASVQSRFLCSHAGRAYEEVYTKLLSEL